MGKTKEFFVFFVSFVDIVNRQSPRHGERRL
jgi:hypothetical protein